MGKVGWKLTGLAFALPLGFVARKAVAVGWRAIRHEDPPRPSNDFEASWSETLAWAALSGVAMAAAELLAARGAARVWRQVTGNEPPGHEREPAEIEA
jgi:hypothetical protein